MMGLFGALNSRSDKTCKQRMRLIGTAFEFRMELHSNMERPVSKLDCLHKATVRGETADDQAVLCHDIPVIIVEFVAVPVPLADHICIVTALHSRFGNYAAWACAKP